MVNFDQSWNPALEWQSHDRAFRIGQTKDVSLSLVAVVLEMNRMTTKLLPGNSVPVRLAGHSGTAHVDAPAV